MIKIFQNWKEKKNEFILFLNIFNITLFYFNPNSLDKKYLMKMFKNKGTEFLSDIGFDLIDWQLSKYNDNYNI